MIATRGTAGRAAASLVQQLGLSMAGTLAATVILSGLTGQEARAPAPPRAVDTPPPILTSGGKFALRAIDGVPAESTVTLTVLPSILPLFTAAAVPPLALDSPPPEALLAASAEAVLPDPPLPPRPPSRHDTKRVAVAMAPPAGRTPVIAMAAIPRFPSLAAEDSSLWTRSKTAYRQVASWSGALIGDLLP